jgi:3'-phosphoadenosine 5'-phosphosulfate (PAPS) 3'-phosphatase
VQIAWVEDGRPRLGVIAEPAAGAVYAAAEGCGAFRLAGGRATALRVVEGSRLPSAPRFVDSTRPGGAVGAWMHRAGARFVECGSIGLKIARIAGAEADVYAKAFRFRLWDVAPGDVLLREAGGWLGTFDGAPVRYDGAEVERRDLLAVPAAFKDEALAALGPTR